MIWGRREWDQSFTIQNQSENYNTCIDDIQDERERDYDDYCYEVLVEYEVYKKMLFEIEGK